MRASGDHSHLRSVHRARTKYSATTRLRINQFSTKFRRRKKEKTEGVEGHRPSDSTANQSKRSIFITRKFASVLQPPRPALDAKSNTKHRKIQGSPTSNGAISTQYNPQTHKHYLQVPTPVSHSLHRDHFRSPSPRPSPLCLFSCCSANNAPCRLSSVKQYLITRRQRRGNGTGSTVGMAEVACSRDNSFLG